MSVAMLEPFSASILVVETDFQKAWICQKVCNKAVKSGFPLIGLQRKENATDHAYTEECVSDKAQQKSNFSRKPLAAPSHHVFI